MLYYKCCSILEASQILSATDPVMGPIYSHQGKHKNIELFLNFQPLAYSLEMQNLTVKNILNNQTMIKDFKKMSDR